MRGRCPAEFTFDGLRIDVSTDCGSTWPATVYNKSDSILATVGDETGTWYPTANTDWRNETVDLSPFAGQNILIRFVNINGYGNNLFVDNVNILGVVGVANALNPLGLQVWPNPANGLFNVALSELPAGTCKFQVHDLAGRMVWNTVMQSNGDAWSGQLDLRSVAKGVYYLRVNADGYSGVHKIVIQ